MRKITIAVIAIACVAGVLIYMNRGDITGKLIEAKLGEYLNNSEYVDEWDIEKITYKDGQLDVSNASVVIKGNKINISSVQATGIDANTLTADQLVFSGTGFANKEGMMSCDIQTITLNNLDFSETGALVQAGEIYTSIASFDDAHASGMLCDVNGAILSMESYVATGPFIAGEIPPVEKYDIQNTAINVAGTDVKIPEIVGEAHFDKATGTCSVTHQPIEVTDMFIMEFDMALANYDPKAILQQYFTNPMHVSEMIEYSYMRLKLEDQGLADMFFNMTSSMSGMSVPEIKRTSVNEILSNTDNFTGSFENGLAIQQAIIDYINNPSSFEFTMNPAKPVSFSPETAEETMLYLADYGISISVNGQSPVEIK